MAAKYEPRVKLEKGQGLSLTCQKAPYCKKC